MGKWTVDAPDVVGTFATQRFLLALELLELERDSGSEPDNFMYRALLNSLYPRQWFSLKCHLTGEN